VAESIYVGWADSPNVELTVSVIGRIILSIALSPVPLMDSPLSITVP
jgi:hypothetical protein